MWPHLVLPVPIIDSVSAIYRSESVCISCEHHTPHRRRAECDTIHSECACVWMYIGLSVMNIDHSIMYTDMSLECWVHKPSQIEIRGVNYTGIVESSDQSWVSVLINQLDQKFTKGETHTVRVLATNLVGTICQLNSKSPVSPDHSCCVPQSLASPHYHTR